MNHIIFEDVKVCFSLFDTHEIVADVDADANADDDVDDVEAEE